MNEEQDIDFGSEDCNGFYYTNEKQIRRMDDSFIMSKIIERYPDFSEKNSENLLKQAFMVIAKDTWLIKRITKTYDVTPKELFSVIYRTYPFLFGSCFVSKLQKLVSSRSYAKLSKTKKSKVSKGTRGNNGVRADKKRKTRAR